MAKAKRSETTVTTVTVSLELSEDEASVLRSVLNRVGGDPHDTPRKYTNAVGRALDDAGIPAADVAYQRNADSLYFK